MLQMFLIVVVGGSVLAFWVGLPIPKNEDQRAHGIADPSGK
jgi:hypothetical protein